MTAVAMTARPIATTIARRGDERLFV